MNIVDDPRKKELFRILKNLYYLAEKDKDIKQYLKLKEIYNRMLRDVFKRGGKEEFEWDNARNPLDSFYTFDNFEKAGVYTDKSIEYKKKKLDCLEKAKKRMDALNRYLT